MKGDGEVCKGGEGRWRHALQDLLPDLITPLAIVV